MKEQQALLFSFLEEWNAGKGISATTSGSTGEPKQIELTRAQIERSARRTLSFFGISKKSRLHCAISFRYIGGKMMIARSLLASCQLTFSAPRLNPEAPEGDKDVDLMSVVTAQMMHIVDKPTPYLPVKRFLVGGSAIDNALWDKIVASPFEVWESYGMTETASHIALRRVVGPSRRRPHFVALPGIMLSLTHDDCLVIKDGDIQVATNDLAAIYPGGSFEILGRKDDVIISGGLKVNPVEMEDKLRDSLDGLCGEFMVSSLPDPLWTSKIILVCKLSSRHFQQEEELRQGIEKRLKEIPAEVIPNRLLPKEIIFVDELPLTESGKLKRKLN